MRVQIDQDMCVGSGQCVMTADHVFDQNPDDGIGQVTEERPAPGDRDAVFTAAKLCPVGAISVTV